MEDIIEYGYNDRTAPRFRVTAHNVNTDAFYNKFRKRFPKYSDKKLYPNKLLNKIIEEFNSTIYQETVNSREGVELPEDLGILFIGNCEPPKKKNINHKLSTIYKKPIGEHNLHSDRLLAKIFYSNYDKKYTFPSRELWSFKGSREFKSLVSTMYPENWMNYIMVEKHMLINRQYNSIITKEKMADIIGNAPVPENYNEFEI